MRQIGKTISLLKRIIKDKNCERMNTSTVKGYLGELLVIQKLGKEGKTIKQAGKQTSYDFAYNNKRIEVKTSIPKDDFKLGYKYWGWGLKHVNKKKVSATHFICLAVDEALRPHKYFIFKVEDLKHFPRGAWQFKKLERVFHYSEGNRKISAARQRSIFLKSRNLLRKRKVKVVGKKGNLSFTLDQL